MRGFAGGIAVHGVGGIFDTITIIVFGCDVSAFTQFGGLAVVGVYAVVLTYVIAKLVGLVTLLRVEPRDRANVS